VYDNVVGKSQGNQLAGKETHPLRVIFVILLFFEKKMMIWDYLVLECEEGGVY
jgi:hypothetical protein